jgi:hypothetical protein
MVDRDLVLRRLMMLEEYLEQLGPFRSMDIETYRQDWKTQQDATDRRAHVAPCDPAIVTRVLQTDLSRFREAVRAIV